MTRVLQRVTTEYSAEEDRLRVAGLGQDEQQVVIWVSRRLLGMLIPVLLQQLDGQFASASPEHRDVLQEFAQQAARDAMGGAPAVQAGADAEVLLAHSVDIGTADYGTSLTFRDTAERSYSLPLSGEALRQWLHILYQADRAAAWQLPQWPDWLTGTDGAAHEQAFH